MKEYHVDAFVPKSDGCGSKEEGWGPQRLKQFKKFLNGYAVQGWRLHSCEYRTFSLQEKGCGCGSSSGTWLVSIFERDIEESNPPQPQSQPQSQP